VDIVAVRLMSPVPVTFHDAFLSSCNDHLLTSESRPSSATVPGVTSWPQTIRAVPRFPPVLRHNLVRLAWRPFRLV
jgi:hypothetical protein